MTNYQLPEYDILPARDPQSDYTTFRVDEVSFYDPVDFEDDDIFNTVSKQFNIQDGQQDWRDEYTLWIHPKED